ncbi:MAG TPA: hypothetical protein VF727_11710 [Allosphingosinicella sp.]|jgi:hypothetical protein
MALYYFHLRDGTDILLDPEGRELPSLSAVAAAALRDARSIISDAARNGQILFDQQIDVEDSGGRVVHSLQFEDAVKIVRDRRTG